MLTANDFTKPATAGQSAVQPQVIYLQAPPRMGGSMVVTVVLLGVIGVLGYALLHGGITIVPDTTPAAVMNASGGTIKVPVSMPAAPAPTAAAITANQQAPAVPTAAAQIAEQAPAAANTLPTAAVTVATVPAAVVVKPDLSKPLRYAAGSDMRPTALPTDAPPPTPLTAGTDWWASADGKCVFAVRSGTTYELCQNDAYTDNEAKSVGAYLHDGLLPGTEVR
jgi:hypothetical protein